LYSLYQIVAGLPISGYISNGGDKAFYSFWNDNNKDKKILLSIESG
jgi:hypothetical protein